MTENEFMIFTIRIDPPQKVLMKTHLIKALANLVPSRAYLFTIITKT
jgi:hypothetical protein